MIRKILIVITTILSVKATFGQTVIKEKVLKINKEDYQNCFSGNWNLEIPKLLASSKKDIRYIINDSIIKIANSILIDTLDYIESNAGNISSDCDTTSISFANPYYYEMDYKVGQNSERILSLDLKVSTSAGGGGNGFMTNLYSFNIDIANNKMFSIYSLFDSINTEKLSKYVVENMESPNEGIYLDEGFNIFGYSQDYPEYGSYYYVGFRVDSTFLILNYSFDYGRGNGINELAIPLADIKPFLNKKYLWILERENR